MRRPATMTASRAWRRWPEIELLHALGKGTALAAPMIVDGALRGEFYATRHVGAPRFAEIDTAYCEALVAIPAGAISRAGRRSCSATWPTATP
jgi:hypothetical protein